MRSKPIKTKPNYLVVASDLDETRAGAAARRMAEVDRIAPGIADCADNECHLERLFSPEDMLLDTLQDNFEFSFS
jgi:hypothetical protein